RAWKDTWDSPTAYALLLALLVCPYLRVVSPLQAVAIDFLPEGSQFTGFPGAAWLMLMEANGLVKITRRNHMAQGDIDARSKSDFGELDPWTAWAYKPRTISLLLIGTCILVWASGALDPESTASNDIVSSVKRGVWAMIAVFLAYSLLQAPSTVLIRPHPAIWRLVHGMAVVYLVALTFLLFQNRDDARQFMKYLHPDLGVELPERSYGADCRIYVPDNPKSRFINVYETLFDEFVLAHIFGWWGKAIMIRNQPLLWVLSVGFELMELTFRHMLPNFNECWWDSIILDILICNWFGICAGMRTVRYFDGKTYEWVGISRQPNIIGKVKRTLGQFTPARWDKDEWHPLLGPWRFIQVLCLCVVFMIVELNTFFLKFCLWIPPRNPLIIYRLVLWWLIAIPTIREYNTYLQDRKPVKKVGAFCWLSLAICIVELLICVKFGHGGSLSQSNAPVVDYILDDCGYGPRYLPTRLVVAYSSSSDEKKVMIAFQIFLLPFIVPCKYASHL
ncbi:phosphatidylserine synthase, partial [Musa troglodytarum]